jgi:hypothetical protein
MSNVKNDLSPTTAIQSGGKDYLVLRPITTNLPPSVPFVTSSFSAGGNAFHYIIRFLIIHTPLCGLNIRILQGKSRTYAFQTSPSLSILVNF